MKKVNNTVKIHFQIVTFLIIWVEDNALVSMGIYEEDRSATNIISFYPIISEAILISLTILSDGDCRAIKLSEREAAKVLIVS